MLHFFIDMEINFGTAGNNKTFQDMPFSIIKQAN